MGIAPLYDQPAYERWRPRYDRGGGAAAAATALLEASDLWLTPRVNDDDNTYREDAGSSFLSAAADHSGNGRTFAQATASDQPVRVDSAQNGKPAWNSDTDARFLVGDAATHDIARNIGGLTVAFVADLPSVSEFRAVFGVTVGADSTPRAAFLTNSNGTEFRIQGVSQDGDPIRLVDFSSSGLTGWGFWLFEFDWANQGLRGWRNNVSVLDAFWNVTPGNTSDTDSQDVTIFVTHPASSTQLRDEVGEIAFYKDRFLTAEEKTDLWKGLGQSAWGLS